MGESSRAGMPKDFDIEVDGQVGESIHTVRAPKQQFSARRHNSLKFQFRGNVAFFV